MSAAPVHVVKRYDTGIGHIEEQATGFLVSFYAGRVRQVECDTMQEARRALRRMAMATR
jgi:hypothetical protein